MDSCHLKNDRTGQRGLAQLAAALMLMPVLGFAQASPFSVGAASLPTTLLAILTPIAVVVVMGLGVLAWRNQISWAWCVGSMVGIVLVFGAPQIVTWVRGMFGV